MASRDARGRFTKAEKVTGSHMLAASSSSKAGVEAARSFEDHLQRLKDQSVSSAAQRGYTDRAETGQDFKLITEDPGRQPALDRITQQAQVSPEKLAGLRQNILTLAEPQVKPRFRRWRKRR